MGTNYAAIEETREGAMTLTPELDAEVQTLTHDEAIGVIRCLLEGEWLSPETVRLAMRVQRRALDGSNLDT
jgi:hypothetical protein